MSENDKHHLISENLYKVLYMVKQLQNGNMSHYAFGQCIKKHHDEIQKLKRLQITKTTNERK